PRALARRQQRDCDLPLGLRLRASRAATFSPGGPMALRRFALVFGIVFLILGAGGFIPGMVSPHSHPDVAVTSGLGLELSLFPINVLHNIVHLLFGIWGLLAARS